MYPISACTFWILPCITCNGRGWDSRVCIVTMLWAKQSWVRISVAVRDFFFSKMSRAALEPTQHPVQMVLGFFLVEKELVHDVEPSLPSSTEVKYEWSFTSTPCSMPSWNGQGQCTFSPSLLAV